MSNHVPRKPVQTAYQRWELASLEEQHQRGSNAAVRRTPEASAADQRQAQEQGHQAGFQQGLQEGLEQGLAEGRAQAHNELATLQAQYAQTLAAQVHALQLQVQTQDAQLAEQVLRLSLDMAKAVLKQALIVQPGLMLPMIRQALDELPSLKVPGILRFNPQDLALAQTLLEEEFEHLGWRCVADEHMERGGCMIETPSNTIDASLSTRWKRLQESLGQLPQPWHEDRRRS